MTRINFSAEPIRECLLPQQSPSIRLATPEQNFGCCGGAREINAIYADVFQDQVIWQPDVYAEARTIADQFGIKYIVDVGCGNSEKLIHFFPAALFQTIGLDFNSSIRLARSTYPDRTFIECDLNSISDLVRVFGEMNYNEPILLILSDVIEHIPDPRLLLAQLRTVLLKHSSNRLVMSTPDRALLGYNSQDSYPENLAHVREWTHKELADFCQAAGFQVERCGHTRANQFDKQYSTIYIQLRCVSNQYMDFLRATGLLHADIFPHYLLLTSEYAGMHSTGGIGAFVVEQRRNYGVENTLCLFTGQEENPDAESFQRFKLISPCLLLDKIDLSLSMDEIVLNAVLHLLFYFPNIAKIEYPDYQGLGCRLAQAKRAGLFPPALQLIVHCHGNTHYLENANQTWYSRSHFNVAEREKISIENADKIVFPTTFLLDLYRETGFEMADEQVIQLRYPYFFKSIHIEHTEQIDTVVFYGKRSTMKGYSLFLAALAADEGQLLRLGIKRIVFIGQQFTETQEDVTRMDVLRSQFEVEEYNSLGWSAAIDKLRSYANNACCVMPYLGDNHPYALLDVTFAGLLPLMLRAGGVPELFAEPFNLNLLADPTETSLLSRICALATLSVEERHRLRVNFLDNMQSTQRSINDIFHQFGESNVPILPQPAVGKATVIVPVFNTDLRFITDLVFGLNNQSMAPVEVIFIDDASEQGYVCDLKEQLQQELRLPYRIISHPVNKGLAGARNTGLNAANSEYVINIDSDDVPRNDFVRNIVSCLNTESHYAAAVCYLKSFDEETDFNEQKYDRYVYRPLGDGVIASQIDNNLGHANAGFRASVLRKLGGWDESDKSMWEDWALYLKLVSTGHRIGIIPQTDMLYRVRKHSMVRTYKVWPAMRRLARNTAGLPRYDSFRLQSVMRSMHSELLQVHDENAALSAELLQVHDENAALSAELNRRSVRAVRIIVARMAKFPRTFVVVRGVGLVIWKSARNVRNKAKSVRSSLFKGKVG